MPFTPEQEAALAKLAEELPRVLPELTRRLDGQSAAIEALRKATPKDTPPNAKDADLSARVEQVEKFARETETRRAQVMARERRAALAAALRVHGRVPDALVNAAVAEVVESQGDAFTVREDGQVLYAPRDGDALPLDQWARTIWYPSRGAAFDTGRTGPALGRPGGPPVSADTITPEKLASGKFDPNKKAADFRYADASQN